MGLKTAIIIPARYGSTRFPGKPLAQLAGRTVLDRVAELSKQAAGNSSDISVHIATDDDRIQAEADRLSVHCVRTSPACKTGTDRVRDAVNLLPARPDFILNMQGDAPLTPPDFLTAMIASASSGADIVTPVVNLTWNELDALRASKKETPFSGTTVAIKADGNAFWFSKNIIPAIRQEDAMRKSSAYSPVYRHIGLYGYTYDALLRYAELPVSYYEELEGLEQLRALENGLTIRCVKVDYKGRPSMTGIDSPADLERAEKLLGT